jgi:Domain of unknown function (DUF1963)
MPPTSSSAGTPRYVIEGSERLVGDRGGTRVKRRGAHLAVLEQPELSFEDIGAASPWSADRSEAAAALLDAGPAVGIVGRSGIARGVQAVLSLEVQVRGAEVVLQLLDGSGAQDHRSLASIAQSRLPEIRTRGHDAPVLTSADVARFARDAGLDDIAEELAALATPGLRLVYVDGEAALGASKLGGLPDLPRDVAWPHAKWPGHENEAMTFFGQLALSDLDAPVWPGPSEGLLSFFCHQDRDHWGVDVGGSARVLFVPAGAKLSRRSPPADLGEEFVLDAAPVTARPELTMPTIGVHVADVLVPFEFGWGRRRYSQDDAYIAMHDRLGEAQGGLPRRPDDRILGWPRHVQGDAMPEIVLMHFADNGISYASGDPEAHAPDWRLLLQIESDRRLGASFGDGGTLFFGVPAEDLHIGRFDRVQAIAQSG